MIASRVLLGGLIVLLPLAIDVPGPARDSSETRVSLSGGTGSYAIIARACDNSVVNRRSVHFTDQSASLDHKFASPVRLGVRAGLLDDEGATDGANRYINPNFSLDWRLASVGAGYFEARNDLPTGEGAIFRKQLSFHVRFGDPKSGAVWAEFLESEPLYSGGGYFCAGAETQVGRVVSFKLGLSVRPYDAGGVSARGEFRIAPALDAVLKARLGESAGIGENAFAAGLTYRMWGRGHFVRPARAAPAQPDTARGP